MSLFNLNDVTEALEVACAKSQEECGLSFEGENLKLNTAIDAQPLVDAILACKELGYLNLAGNTLGVDAAKALSKALEKHPEFKRALWKDLFTGRLKKEIPKALQHLGDGLVTAGARLTELDLSDNAFGPIGVNGLASLLQSRACFALRILRLNNNGLGESGGKLLASALTNCHQYSTEQGTPLQLKIFIAGRNRLENEGAKALAKVFEIIGTLEEIAMPQNGIYHVGITALSKAFSENKNLQVLNLNDNTLGPKGSKALADALSDLQQLRSLNLGDCLLKTKGAMFISEALRAAHPLLEDVNMECNEINAKGGKAIANALVNKQNLTKLLIDGNQFGSNGIDEIREILNNAGRGDALCEFNDDEGSDDEEEEEEEEEEDENSEEDENEEEEQVTESEEEEEKESNQEITIEINNTITPNIFLDSPTAEKFLELGENRISMLIKESQNYSIDEYLEKYIPILMKVGALCASSKSEVSEAAIETSNALYKELFNWAQRTNKQSMVNNALLVHLGLIKCEDKKLKPNWNLDGCMLAIEHALKQQYFPTTTKDTLTCFIGRCKNITTTVKRIMTTLNVDH